MKIKKIILTGIISIISVGGVLAGCSSGNSVNSAGTGYTANDNQLKKRLVGEWNKDGDRDYGRLSIYEDMTYRYIHYSNSAGKRLLGTGTIQLKDEVIIFNGTDGTSEGHLEDDVTLVVDYDSGGSTSVGDDTYIKE